MANELNALANSGIGTVGGRPDGEPATNLSRRDTNASDRRSDERVFGCKNSPTLFLILHNAKPHALPDNARWIRGLQVPAQKDDCEFRV